jgi:hypothetical protein
MRASQNAPLTRRKSVREYPPGLPCALLGEDGTCLVYEARPLLCRHEHSMDASECERANAMGPKSSDARIPHSAPIVMVGDFHLRAYVEALRENGVDPGPFELQEALHVALSVEDATADGPRGAASFESAKVFYSEADAHAAARTRDPSAERR